MDAAHPLMLGDSQIRIIEQAPDHFVAYDPPYVLFGLIFITFGVLVGALMGFVTWKTAGWRMVYSVGYLAAVIFALIGAGAATTKGYVSGSITSGQIATYREIFGARFDGMPVLLRDVRLARVEDVKNLHRVILVMRDGQTVSLTSASDRAGYDDLAQAINQVLGH